MNNLRAQRTYRPRDPLWSVSSRRFSAKPWFVDKVKRYAVPFAYPTFTSGLNYADFGAGAPNRGCYSWQRWPGIEEGIAAAQQGIARTIDLDYTHSGRLVPRRLIRQMAGGSVLDVGNVRPTVRDFLRTVSTRS